jgi:hypothetical protein
MTNQELNEKIEEILAGYPIDSATDKEKTALLALEDGKVLALLGWSQEEVEEVYWEIKEKRRK